MFPIHDQKGQVIGFGGRVINSEDTPKYYNSPETPLFQKGHELYGLFVARRAIRDAGRALVVEGYMDVVALAQYGIEYAVAALGTATTPFHITKLMRQTDEIVFCFDGDNAGRTAAWRAAMNALPALTDGLKLRFLFLPKEHDPDSYVREFGKEKFEAEIQVAMPLSQYIVQHLSKQNPLNSQEDKVQFLNDAEPILRQIIAPRFSLMLRKRIAELAEVTDAEMQSLLKLPAPNRAPAKATQKQSRAPLSIKKRFVLMLLMQPSLAKKEYLAFAQGFNEEDVLLQASIHAALEQPQSKPATLLHTIESQVDPRLLHEIELESALFVKGSEFELEFEGACTQLGKMIQKRQDGSTLDALKEKPLSAWTDEDRDRLKKLTAKK
jgi:DNA primase